MKVINVELTVKPGKQKEYEAFIDKLVQGSRAEAGNISYNHFKKSGQTMSMKLLNIGRMLMQLPFITTLPISKPFFQALVLI